MCIVDVEKSNKASLRRLKRSVHRTAFSSEGLAAVEQERLQCYSDEWRRKQGAARLLQLVLVVQIVTLAGTTLSKANRVWETYTCARLIHGAR